MGPRGRWRGQRRGQEAGRDACTWQLAADTLVRKGKALTYKQTLKPQHPGLKVHFLFHRVPGGSAEGLGPSCLASYEPPSQYVTPRAPSLEEKGLEDTAPQSGIVAPTLIGQISSHGLHPTAGAVGHGRGSRTRGGGVGHGLSGRH